MLWVMGEYFCIQQLLLLEDKQRQETILMSITIPNTVVSIGEFAFYDCTSLSTIDLAEGLKVIQDDAFVGCINLERLFVPSSVEEIGMGAFERCRKLSSINISGDSHTSLSDDVFKDCPP